MGRKKDYGGNRKQKVMPYDAFINRIRTSFYFGNETQENEMSNLSFPMAQYASELFSKGHQGYSLNRLQLDACGLVQGAPTCSLIMALIYLDRLNVIDPGFIHKISPQELFIVTMMISTKFYCGHDQEIYLSDWAEHAKITEDTLKKLELEFLSAIDWNIYISNEDFFSKLQTIEKTLAQREGLKRGWLTYAELRQMLPSFTLIKFLFNDVAVMAVSYAASVISIASAFFLVSQIPGTILHRANVNSASNTSSNASASQLLDINSHGTNSTELLLPATRPTLAMRAGENNTVTTVLIQNGSCNALNVENELQNLEKQYQEEAEQEELRKRNNEIKHLSYTNDANTICAAQQTGKDSQITHWHSLKHEYSDDESNHETAPNQLENYGLSNLPMHHNEYFKNYFSEFGNNTGSIFWNLLAEQKMQTFVRLPFVWLKFM